MNSPRRKRSISLCQPHSTSSHPSGAGVPTRLPDALGFHPSTPGGQRATLSTFPLVPLTREPTCTQAIDPGISRSTLTPADTSRPFLEFRAFSRLPVARFPMVGPWFTTPWRLVSQSHGAVAWRFWSPCPSHVPFPFASSRQRPVPSVPWTPYPFGPLCGPSHTPFPAPSPCPCIPSLYPGRAPATLWRWPSGPSSFQGPFRGLLVSLPIPCPIPLCLIPPPSLSPVPRPWPNPPGCLAAPFHPSPRVYTPPGRQQPCGAGPLDPHPSGDRFVRLPRVAPLPPLALQNSK